MSSEAMKWAMEYAPPMPSQLVPVLAGLAYHADSKGRGAYPSVPRLAAYACKAPRQVRRDLRALEDLKLIREGDQSKASHVPADRRPTVYDLAMERTVPGGRAGDDDRTRTSARTLASSRARGVATRKAKKPSSAGTSGTERPDVDVRGDVDVRADVQGTSDRTWASAATGRGRPPNQLPEPTTEPKTTTSSASAVLEAFGAFWLTYPKRRDKEAAKKAFVEAVERGADPARIVAAAQTYARERADEDPKYTKYPSTWLNNGCYDDEPDAPPGPRLRAVSGGWVPFQNPENHDVYDEPLI